MAMPNAIKPWVIQENLSSGTTIVQNAHSTHVYTPGGYIERVLGSFYSTRADGSMLSVVVAAEPTIVDYGPAVIFPWQSVQVDFDISAGDGSWPSGTRYAHNLYVAWQRSGSDVTIGADASIWWGNIAVIHLRYDYSGAAVDTTTTLALDAQGLVHDLMGRGFNSLVEYDPVRVEPGTSWGTTIPHAAWWNGVSAREVLAYAVSYAPGMWWAVGEPGISGLPKFRVGRWDAPPRYVFAPGMAGVEMSGGVDQLANRALVRYIGSTFGSTKTTWVAEVRANLRPLAASGQYRTMIVDVTGEGLMSTDDARIRGVAALVQAAQARTSGKVTVSGPVYDRVEGRMVDPWELEPGCTALVSDAPLSYGRSTSLADSIGADGVSVFRVRSTSYEASSDTATLDLDGGSRSLIDRLRADATPRRYDVSDARL